ncbi:hypothetical protein BHU72_09975 [Desulfuribacillus stibiiarsenatis]|uniref:Recombinase family protein n=1 Tax=Desulfuribacillus stibiiarsenatis TaxID=1390249 RepID=A0A1E5L9B1_9FIRM|nr:recombinase family protein [Desulfuribacillus stibiiarsenatis]OEH86579.1 hypothetical protein BHU72_09975 [Desulfuribacillus stibiiarsenatis]
METIAYYRRSTTMQQHSIQMQRYKAFEKAAANHLIIDKELIDDAISARKTNIDEREQLKVLLSYIREGKVKNVLVYKRDRLARNVIQHIKLYRIFKKYNVNVFFTADDEQEMKYSANGEFYEIFVGYMVQLEGKQIHERIRAKNVAAFRSGNYKGPLPFGYDTFDNSIERNEQKLSLVKELYEMLYNGHTLNELADFAKSHSTERKWTPTYIRELLQNSTYKGIRIFKVPNAEPMIQEYKMLKIIDEEKWQVVYDILESTKKHKKAKEPLNLNYFLIGIVICKRCYNPLKGRKSKPIYHCTKSKTHLKKDDLESLVLQDTTEYISTIFTSDYNELISRYCKRHVVSIEKKISDNIKEIEKLKDMLFHAIESTLNVGEIDNTEIRNIYTEYRTKRNEIEHFTKEIYELEKQII